MAKVVIGAEIKVDGLDAAGQSVGSFKKQLREAQGELVAMADKFGIASKEAQDAAKKVAGLKDTIGDAKDLAETFNPDKKFVALGGAIQGVVAGFSAYSGVMGLLGVESKETEKLLLKVQSAMALQQGISGVTGSIDSFKKLGKSIQDTTVFQKASSAATSVAATVQKVFTGSVATTSVGFKVLRGAIISTGIGLLIVAIGALINNFDSIKKAVMNLLGPFKFIMDAIGNLITAVTDFFGITSEADRATEKLNAKTAETNKTAERQIELMEAQGATAKEIRAVKNKMYQDEIDNLTKILELQGELSDEETSRLADLQQMQKVLSAEGVKEAKDEEAKAKQKKIDDDKKANDAAKAAGERAKAAGKTRAAENERIAQAAAQKEIDNLKNKNQTIIELAQIAGKDTVAIRAAQIDEEIALLKKKGKKFVEGIAVLEKEKIIAAAKEVAAGEQKSIDALKLKNEQIIQLAEIAGQKTVDIRAKQIDEEIALLKSKTGNFTEAIAELEREKVVAGAQAAADAKVLVDEKKAAGELLAKELKKVTEQTELADLKTKYDAEYLLLQGNEAARALLLEKYGKDGADITKKYSDIKIAQDEKERKSKQDSIRAVGDALGTLSDIIGKDTAAGKAMAVAQALINTYLGASEVIKAKSTLPEPFGTIQKIASVAAIIATGIKSVKAITAVKVPGGGGGGGVSVPSVSAIAPLTPQAPQAQITSLSQGSINAVGNAANRAYVLETDVSNNQERIRRLNRASRIN
jgi:hypothetical protein